MNRVAVVGCGKIADEHCAHLSLHPDCELVGFVDKESLMAKQLAERMGSNSFFNDVQEMLEFVKPDAVHITTPPQSHYEIGKLCIQNNCHVFIEKPAAIDQKETEELVDLAIQHNRMMTVGHDHQFSTAARLMRKRINAGEIGGQPIHLESYYSYDLSNKMYAKALLGDENHWVRQLPGKLLHNVISHGIAKLAEYLQDEGMYISAIGRSSDVLQSLGETEIVDELRVLLADSRGVTAYFTFSSQMKPGLHMFRAFGPKGGMTLDCLQQTVISLRGEKYKSYIENFLPHIGFAGQYVENVGRNIKEFARKELHMKSGMRYLINMFYQAIKKGNDPPIPYREIILKAKIMDEIFKQVPQHQVKG